MEITGNKISLYFLITIILICVCSIIDWQISNSNLTIPFLIAGILSIFGTTWSIPKFKSLKLKQIIREEGPASHFEKSGTPTMGGLIIVPIGLIVGNLSTINSNNYLSIILISGITISYMIIGCLDDLTSFKKNSNTGLSPNKKIILQSLAALGFIYLSTKAQLISSSINLEFGHYVDIGLLIWPLALFVLLAESNATNLTDGLDGLAAGCGALVLAGLAFEITIRGSNVDQTLASFSIALSGAWLGFLFQNKKPAKIFMGDTGSLALGASISGIALISNNLLILLIMGGVFFAESLSVIIQVSIFKISKKISGYGKRVFLMAPLHHHYELTGVGEEKIVKNFLIATGVLVLLGLLIGSYT